MKTGVSHQANLCKVAICPLEDLRLHVPQEVDSQLVGPGHLRLKAPGHYASDAAQMEQKVLAWFSAAHMPPVGAIAVDCDSAGDYEIDVALEAPERITDAAALDEIVRLLAGEVWNELLADVAVVVRGTGREVSGMWDEDDE